MIYLLSPTAREGTLHLPMIQFETIGNSIDFTQSDTLLFTSKQAVKSVEMIDPNWKLLPSVAIGSETKKEIEKYGGEVIHASQSFYGESLVQDIAKRFAEKRFLYLRPEKVSSDLKEMLSEKGIIISEQVIYQTRCIPYTAKDRPVKSACVIFTSPSTIRCFLKNFSWDESYTAIVIGEKTVKHLPTNAKYVVAAEPTIDSCIQKAKVLELKPSA